ncbi:MAG TPA: type II toxin-antitoxin system VapC family toxin [Longimicrobiaceae bacterium]|nr:type II toxin-antitoxin system VapC family toxin [Longimicrobiaceae bacterium]
MDEIQRLCFLDTSAIAKLYIKEPGSRRLVNWVGHPALGFRSSVRVYVARTILPEAISAITRRRNDGRVDRRDVLRLWNSVFADFSRATTRYEVVELTEAVALRAAFLVAKHGLRGYDAVQLASALSLQIHRDPTQPLVFICADHNLSAAARAEGLDAANPVTDQRRSP